MRLHPGFPEGDFNQLGVADIIVNHQNIRRAAALKDRHHLNSLQTSAARAALINTRFGVSLSKA
jgi:hypothetical protein